MALEKQTKDSLLANVGSLIVIQSDIGMAIAEYDQKVYTTSSAGNNYVHRKLIAYDEMLDTVINGLYVLDDVHTDIEEGKMLNV